MSEISFLLGAGFSRPAGYPIADDLNKKILGFDTSKYVYDGGSLCEVIGANSEYTIGLRKPLQFSIDFANFYDSKIEKFDYEKFFDYAYKMRTCEIEEIDKTFLEFSKSYHPGEEFNNYFLDKFFIIYNQLILLLLVDHKGRNHYEEIHKSYGCFPEYNRFLNILENFGKENTVHIHSLNHDVYFERFNYSDWLKGELSDGFRELGSPYYGRVHKVGKVRLSYFANDFSKKFRLYKLHGSIDYYLFHKKEGFTFLRDCWIKKKPFIAPTDLFKEVQTESGELQYMQDVVNFHADVLMGPISKIFRYSDPLYYDIVFNHFRKNLQQSKQLLVIGYSGNDAEINKIINDNFSGELICFDPYPSQNLIELCNKFSATPIKTGVEDIQYNQLPT